MKRFILASVILILLIRYNLYKIPFVYNLFLINGGLTGRALFTDVSCMKFYLWTRNNSNYEELIFNNETSIVNSNFDKNRRTVIGVHGMNDKPDQLMLLKNEMLPVEDLNFIVPDFREIVNDESLHFYHFLVYRLYAISRRIAEFVKFLHEVADLSTENVHIWGISFGGHICGMVGLLVKEFGLPPIDRVTGIDPSGPLFILIPESRRISPSSGSFVDIIHTDSCFYGCAGNPLAIGHLDFYPNGGIQQPACPIDEPTFHHNCSHIIAYEYYLESMRGGVPFTSVMCNSFVDFQAGLCNCSNSECTQMGHNASRDRTPGLYYLNANSHIPYAQG